jgi:cyclohexanone monooxygenase
MSVTPSALSPENLGFNPDQLADRYRHERDKRVRADAESQFVKVTHDSVFANKYLENDPYCEPLERGPIKDEREVIIIGGGWVGMMTAARLTQAGVSDVRIVESAADFGGTWY